MSELSKKVKLPLGDVAKLSMHAAFAVHSRKGYRCASDTCGKFIPETLNGKYGIKCPYPNCDFFGKVETLQMISHPTSLCSRNVVSLDSTVNTDSKTNFSLHDQIKSEDVLAENKIIISQQFSKEHSVMLSVLDQQMSILNRQTTTCVVQNRLMLEAFKIMCDKYPEDMISYLVHCEVEEVLMGHPAVSEVGVAGVPDAHTGEAGKAWIVLASDQSTSADEIKAYCRETLAGYKVPKYIEFIDALPKTLVGKVLRRELAAREKTAQPQPETI